MRRKKPPILLISVVAILFVLSLSILLTQEDKTEETPLITTRQNTENTTDTAISNPAPINPDTQTEIDLVPQGMSSFGTLIQKGDQAFLGRDFKQALVFYIKANQTDPNNTLAYYKIIDTYLYTENIPVAEKNLNLLKEAGINNSDIVIRNARIKLVQSEPEAAINLLVNTEQTLENLIYQIIAQAMLQNHTQAHQLASQLNDRIQNESTSITPKTNAGQNLFKAYEVFSTFESGNDVYLNTLIGQAILAIDEPKIAREFFYRAIEQDTNYRDAWIGLGYAFLTIKNYSEADKALDTARQRDPYKAETYFYQALSQGEQSNYKRAIGLLEQAKNQGYKDQTLLDQYLAINFNAAEDYASALPYFLSVINQKSVPITYYVTPIWIMLEVNSTPAPAIELAMKAVSAYPENALSYNLLGWAQIYANDYQTAKTNLNQALKLDPELAAAYLNYGLLFKKQNKLEAAIPFFQKAEELALSQDELSIAARAEVEQRQIKLTLENS